MIAALVNSPQDPVLGSNDVYVDATQSEASLTSSAVVKRLGFRPLLFGGNH
jgi:hypothetical protein